MTIRRPTGASPSWIHVAVIGALGVAAIATLARMPRVLGAEQPHLVSASRRALAPATFYRVDTRLLIRAALEIPRGATYSVVGGDPAKTLLAYWLLPRRRTKVGSGTWIVLIGRDLPSLGLRYARVMRVDHASELAEIKR